MKLSIAVVTMNRDSQLLEALESCVDCNLPTQTEFVILDNASTDNTARTVDEFKSKHPEITVNYHYSDVNLGVGGGRSLAFELAKGEIVYFLDDDAVISDDSKKLFFTKSLDLFYNFPEIASLTTDIYDELLKYNRECATTKKKIANLPITFYYLGGSHFLRKEYFDTPLYFNIKYGSEEYAPSIKVQDKGYYNVFDKSLCVVHKPKVNKWVNGTESMKNILINGSANIYATKRILYPSIFRPLLWMGYLLRLFKHLKKYPGAINEASTVAKKLVKENKGIRKIRYSTVIKLYKEFGVSIF